MGKDGLKLRGKGGFIEVLVMELIGLEVLLDVGSGEGDVYFFFWFFSLI